ncbi:FUSC family protein [Leucobacter rhizosphaerae]|uniref:FUSC family protein n=1 Tax=Leucobacter rhizosphaerae TaxID=2932245 RepID=A0ABY4FWX4_9MICO|nr:FUSC family protein [Leucobacter rhizosphaerae]UOQ60767.1 FUSC family protein [Leucobacter rhizosphaerae]
MSGPPTRPWRRVERRLTGRFTVPMRPSLLQLLKGAASAILTWFVCLAIFPEQLPIFGAIAALIVMQDNIDQSLTRGIERVVGVLLGVSVALGAGAVFGPQAWLFIAAIIVSMGVGWLFRMTPTSTNQVAISALLMIALGGLQLGYGFERLIETAIGAAIGVAINALVVAPVRTSSVHTAIAGLTEQTALVLRRLADSLAEARDEAWLAEMYAEARQLQTERTRVHGLLRQARESLRLNPRSSRHRQGLADDDALFQRLQPIVTQVIGMARALYDLYAADLVTDPSVVGMAEEMRRAAHDLELLVHPDAPDDRAPEPAALTAPYTIPRPHPDHWVLIGSLMEDLRRVRGRITGDLEL